MKQVRDTSITAYLEIKREGLLSETRQLIYEYVYSHGPKTAREVLRDLNLETNLSGRFTEMREMGVFKEVGKRKCTVTGRMVIEWDVTQYLPKPIPKPVDESKPSAEELFKQTYGKLADQANTSYNGNDMVKFANQFANSDKEWVSDTFTTTVGKMSKEELNICFKRQMLKYDLCKCGHERRYHGKTTSINYTEGKCSKCECEHFLMANPPKVK